MHRMRIISFLIMMCFFSVNSVSLMAAPLSDQVPQLQVGDAWTIKVSQYDLHGTRGNLKPATLYQFRVSAAALVDGESALIVDIAEYDTGIAYGRLYLDALTRQVLRWEKRASANTVYNFVTADAADRNGLPVMAERSLVPFDMPSFTQEKDEARYRYVPAIEGDWGFEVEVHQTQVDHPDFTRIALTQGPKTILQDWHRGEIWWRRAEQPGFFVAELVDVNLNTKSFKKHKTPKVIERDIRKPEGRWSYPTEASATQPWSEAGGHDHLEHRERAHKLESHDAEASHFVWSGYWWASARGDQAPTPATRTYADGGLLEKYDQYYRARYGRDNAPSAKQWELDNYSTGEAWFGHCNGLAAASILAREPRTGITAEGIDFSVGDLKGLLSEAYYDINVSAFIGDRYYGEGYPAADPSAYDAHRAFVTYLGQQGQAMVLDIDRRSEVWNFPMYKYEMTVTEDTENAKRVNVVCKAFFASASVGANYLGRKHFVVTYKYWLTVDQNGNPTPGPSGWIEEGQDDKQVNPDFIWIPESNPPSGYYRSHNKGLDWNLIRDILNTKPATQKLELDSPLTGQLVNGAPKWFELNVLERSTYTIQTAAGTTSDTVLAIHADPNQEALAENDDISNGNNFSRVSLSLNPGTYYIMVRGYDNNQNGSFVLTATCLGCDGTRDYPELTVNAAAITGEIANGGDANWFQFTVAESGSYTIESWLGSLSDTVLALHTNTTQNAIAENDDKASGNYASRITRDLTAGTYFVKVTAYSAEQTGNYTISVKRN